MTTPDTMTILPSLIDLTPRVNPHKLMFDEVISSLTSKFSVLWTYVGDGPCFIGRRFSVQQQRENELKSEKLLLDPGPQSVSGNGLPQHLSHWRDGIRDFVLESVDQGKRVQIKEMLISFSNAGDEFVSRTRAFDENLQFDSVFQALRNLWIVNSMQVTFGLPICVSPSGFAYSLLYTYTDNFLDSEVIPRYEKEAFSNIFARRLAGFDVPEVSPMLAKVSPLVKLIETEYPHDLFPEVYLSLLAIHRAQQESVQQQVGDQHIVGPDILTISVEKGGTSVVADAYLAKGRLTLAETEFAFSYGVFLQFVDDLQDVKEDLIEGSETLFTHAVTAGTLDATTNRLLRYLRQVLFSASLLNGPQADGLPELIYQGGTGIILESIALNPEMFSEGFAKTAEQFSPLRFEAIRRMHAKHASLVTKFGSHEDRLSAHKGVGQKGHFEEF
jgi:hypothetical protein